MHLLLNTGPANTLNPADELHVVASGQVLLQAAGETDGPGEPRGRRDLAPVRKIHGADQPHERRLAGTVPADQPDIPAFGDVERKVAEHHLTPAQRQIGFRDVVEANHTVTFVRYLSLYSIRPTSSVSNVSPSGYTMLVY